MNAIIILIGSSFVVLVAFLIAFIHAMRHNQFEDTATPPMRMLFDNELPAAGTSTPQQPN